MKYVHTNIACQDWKTLSEFYIKTFDCKVMPPIRNQSGDWLERGTGLKNAKLEGVHLLLPGYGDHGPTLEIYEYGELENELIIASANSKGFGHIAFEVENVEKILALLIENGGSELGKITKRKIESKGDITFVYAKDPEGNILELQKWEYGV